MLRSEPGNGELKHREMLLLEATSIDRDVVQGPSMGIARGIPMQEGLHCKRVPTARGTPQCIARRMWHMPAGYALCFLQRAPALPSLPVVATCCFPGADLCQALRCRGGVPLPRRGRQPLFLVLRATARLCQVCPISCSTLTACLAKIAITPPGAFFLLLLFFFPQQDELEFGYVQAPHKTFPVVFDSPRNRGLKDFAFKKILVCYCIAHPLFFPPNPPPGWSLSPLPSSPGP